MRAAPVRAPGAIECVETPEPEPKPGQVLVKTVRASPCGSDLHHVFLPLQGDRFPCAHGYPGHEGAGDVEEGEDVAAQIEQRVEFDRRFGALERRPAEQGEAEIDGGGVERVDGLVEIGAEIVIDVEAPGGADQTFGEVGVNAPVAFLVGIGQGGARDASRGYPCDRAWLFGRANRPR